MYQIHDKFLAENVGHECSFRHRVTTATIHITCSNHLVNRHISPKLKYNIVLKKTNSSIRLKKFSRGFKICTRKQVIFTLFRKRMYMQELIN
jgi:hypothetical protein